MQIMTITIDMTCVMYRFEMFVATEFKQNREVMFKTQAAVFYRDLKPRGAAEWF